MQLDRTQRREDRRGDRRRGLRPLVIERLEHFIDVRLDPSSDAHHSPHQRLTRRTLTQPAFDQSSQHRLQLAGRPRQQHHALIAVIDPQAGRASPRVLDHDRTGRDHRLPPIDLRHRHREAAGLEPLAETRRDGFVLRQRPLEGSRHRLPRDVVVGRAEAAAEDQQIDAREQRANRMGELVPRVADHGLDRDVDAEPIELLGDVQRIRVEL